MYPDRMTRREILRTGGIVAATPSIAGCLDVRETDAPESVDDEDEEPDPDLEVNGRYLSPAFPIEFVDPGFEEATGFARGARLTYVHWHGTGNSHWHQSPIEIAAGETLSGRTRFLEEGAIEVPLGDDEAYFQRVTTAAETPTDFVSITVDGSFVDIETAGEGGESEGEVGFELWNDDGRQWRAPPLPIEIV